MSITKIYSITYDGNQPTEHEVYDNSGVRTVESGSYLFEYQPMIKIIDASELNPDDYIGIFSWKFPIKTGLFKKKLYWLMDKHPNYDIYNCCQEWGFAGKYLRMTEGFHPGFMELFNPLCQDLNLTVSEPKEIIYSNHFIAKFSVYKEYVEKIVKPAISLLETKYKDLAWRNAMYRGLTADKLKEFTGLDYYTFHTFTLERLISIYLENNKQITVKNLTK